MSVFTGPVHRTFRGELSTVCSTHFENCSHIPSEETVIFVPCAETFFQVVASETKLFMRALSAIFQNISPSGSRWDWQFGEHSQKKSLPVVADKKDSFRTDLMKNAKK